MTVWNGAAVLGQGVVRAQRSEPRPLAQHGRPVQVRRGERWRRERLRAEQGFHIRDAHPPVRRIADVGVFNSCRQGAAVGRHKP